MAARLLWSPQRHLLPEPVMTSARFSVVDAMYGDEIIITGACTTRPRFLNRSTWSNNRPKSGSVPDATFAAADFRCRSASAVSAAEPVSMRSIARISGVLRAKVARRRARSF